MPRCLRYLLELGRPHTPGLGVRGFNYLSASHCSPKMRGESTKRRLCFAASGVNGVGTASPLGLTPGPAQPRPVPNHSTGTPVTQEAFPRGPAGPRAALLRATTGPASRQRWDHHTALPRGTAKSALAATQGALRLHV